VNARLLWLGLAIVLLVGTMSALAARAGVEPVYVESYCPEPGCLVDDYVLTGFRQTEPLVEIVYYPLGAPFGPQAEALIRAVNDWGSATNSATDTSYAQAAGLPANSICGGAYGAPVPPGYDGQNTITWGPIGGLAIGRACWSGVDECDIVLDSGWGGAANEEAIRTVAMHEVGHCLGLGHSEVQAAVMWASYSNPKALHADDRAGFCAIYGCNGGSPPTPPPPTPTVTATSPTATVSPTPTATPTRLWKRCGRKLVPLNWTCAFAPGVSRD